MQQSVQEPQGVGFYSINDGTTHYAKLEPTIAAYINSSDMGINASRGQDFGWRLSKEWVKRIKAFRRDATQMAILSARNNGQKPTTVQILHYLYGEDLRAYEEELEENEHPFEEQYQRDISEKSTVAPVVQPVQEQLPNAVGVDDDDLANVIDDAVLESETEVNTDAVAEAATTDEPPKQTAIAVDSSKADVAEPVKVRNRSTKRK